MNATTAIDLKPLIGESSTAESSSVKTELERMDQGPEGQPASLVIPDYQRDADQWDDEKKSLLIESVINNLTIPAFFFEVSLTDEGEKNYVIDGQQRLTTLRAFYKNEFKLVDAEDAPYISPNSTHYAGKTFDQLPNLYKGTFRSFRLTVIKLRNVDNMRFEIFRRINQGGTPLSGQDIRLAYWGESRSVAFIRLAGIREPDTQGAKRAIEGAKRFSLTFPWTDSSAFANWKDFWGDSTTARGQTASETFLWSLIAAQPDKLDALLKNSSALGALKVRFNGTIDDALDACCAQYQYQDNNPQEPALLVAGDEVVEKFFPAFQEWIGAFLEKGSSLPLTKHRTIASLIGCAYACGISSASLTGSQWTALIEFARSPRQQGKTSGIEWPESKGRWEGKRGYRAQFEAAKAFLQHICK
jgi:hypothetical protein